MTKYRIPSHVEEQNEKALEVYHNAYKTNSKTNRFLTALSIEVYDHTGIDPAIGNEIVNAAIDAALSNCGHGDYRNMAGIWLCETDEHVRFMCGDYPHAIEAYERYINCFPSGEKTVSYWAE